MKRTVRIGFATALLFASFTVLAASPRAGEAPLQSADPSPSAPPDLDPATASARGQLQPDPALARRPAPTLPTFIGAATVGRTRYRYTLVGTDPQARRARNVVVPVLIIPTRLEFRDGTVLDTTEPDSCLGGGLTQLNVTLQSPLFQNFDYGDGPRQFLEHIRRLEYWKFTGPGRLNPGYSVRLAPTVLPKQTLVLSSKSVTENAPCAATGGTRKFGHIDISDSGGFFSQLPTLFPQLGANAGTFVLILLPFTDFTSNGKEVLVAYHDALPTRAGTITYAAAQLGVVKPGPLVYIGPLSHEFAEWLDDPFGTNDTPVWGHTGQVPDDCVTGLEVGDPLTGTALPPVRMPNGISYQAQETAFVWWFFGQVPSPGFDGWYSTGGTFKTPAPPCH